jgi:erythromycin esterase
MSTRPRVLLIGWIAWLTLPASAQAPDAVRSAFHSWVSQSRIPLGDADLPAPTLDLAPFARRLGAAKLVGLSEGQHGAAEPLHFRNRLFKHLVEHEGFAAIALESGIVEGRVLNDYVTQGKGELNIVLRQGLSNGFETFRQNGELIRWMREYNERLPRGASPVQIFGIDVPGSPGNFDATRRPDTALRTALAFVGQVDAPAAAELHARVERFLPVLADINAYGDLAQGDRDSLTAAVADLVSLLERQRASYVSKSSKGEFEWAERAAVGARQADTWFRRMPLQWKLEQGLAWTREAMQVRDRAMADNLDWVRARLGPRARVLVFAASGHLAKTEVTMPGSAFGGMVPLGSYLQDRYGADYLNVLNLVANGEIHYCSANPRKVLALKPPPASAVESWFLETGVARFALDLRRAPAGVSPWLQQVHDHWNGFGAAQFPTARAFDLAYFVSPLTPACLPL